MTNQYSELNNRSVFRDADIAEFCTYFNENRREVMALFMTGVQLTAQQAADALKRSPWTVQPRCSELVTGGYLVTTGERRRSTRSTRLADVLKWSGKSPRVTP